MLTVTAPGTWSDGMCPLCLAAGPHAVLAVDEGQDGRFTLLLCTGCASGFLLEPTRPDLGQEWTLPGLRNILLELEWDLSDGAAVLAQLQRPPGTRLLHLGCGLGNIVDIARHDLGWSAVGIGGTALAAEGCAMFGPWIVHATIDADTLPDGPFDVILITEALEAADDPRGLLTACQERLAPGGTLLITGRSGSGLHSGMDAHRLAAVAAPGSLRVLPSGTGLAAALGTMGLEGHVVSDGDDRLVVVGGARPDGIPPPELRYRTLQGLLARATGDPHRWNGLACRLLDADLAAGDWVAARAMVTAIAADWRQRHGVDPCKPGLIVAAGLDHRVSMAPGTAYPLSLALVLFALGLLAEAVSGGDPVYPLQFYRKAYAIGAETSRYLDHVGVFNARIAITVYEARQRSEALMCQIAPEFSFETMRGMRQASRTGLDRFAGVGGTGGVAALAAKFIEETTAGRYHNAGLLDPLLDQPGDLQSALGGNVVLLCDVLYCRGIVALNGLQDGALAHARFSALAAAAVGPGERFAALAADHQAMAKAMMARTGVS